MTAFLFDVDNTLTPPRQKMDQSFLAFFLDWMRDRSVYLVSGSDEKKIFQQMPSSIITRCSGVFSSMGNKLSIDKELIYAFMHQESMFNTSAKSNQGAMGLMQVLPSTAKFITSSKDVKRNNANILKVPEINLEVGQEYIEYLLGLEIVSNNLIYLAAAYNGGPGNLKKWKEETNFLEDPLFFMESIPSRETRWFIEKILTKYWIYQNKNNQEMTSLKMLANGQDPLY